MSDKQDPIQLEDSEGEKVTIEIKPVIQSLVNVAGNALYPPIPEIDNPRSIREWWHNLLRDYGKYPCYGVFLALPTDFAIIKYLSEYGKELQLITEKDCLILVPQDKRSGYVTFDDDWAEALKENVEKGYSLAFSRVFDVSYNDFPCLILFEDVRASEYVVISYQDISVDEIAQKTRVLFSLMRTANLEKQRPIEMLMKEQKKEELAKTGRTLIGKFHKFAEGTFQAAVEAWIKSLFK